MHDPTGIVDYMKQQAGPSSILLEQTEDVKKFINTREIAAVAYFHDNPGTFSSTATLVVFTDMMCVFRVCSPGRVCRVWEPGPY